MTNIKKINVNDIEISVSQQSGREDYICLTDMVKAKEDDSRAADVIKNWIRTRSTIEFLGTWESIYNPSFKVVEFDHFRKEAGTRKHNRLPKVWGEVGDQRKGIGTKKPPRMGWLV